METVKRSSWQVMPLSTPLLKKKCKCKSNLYYSSDKFRLNSQKKSIDVWLIYKCIKCDNTCNITILSRTKPDLIDKELYHRFSMNDEGTAWKYAFDAETFRRNNLEPDYSNIEYEIISENISLHDISVMETDIIEFEIISLYNLDLKLTTIIRKCLDISPGQLEKMLSAGIISVQPSVPLKKSKVRSGIIVSIHKKKLKLYMEKNI